MRKGAGLPLFLFFSFGFAAAQANIVREQVLSLFLLPFLARGRRRRCGLTPSLLSPGHALTKGTRGGGSFSLFFFSLLRSGTEIIPF